MFPDKSAFISYKSITHLKVRMGNNSYLPVLARGSAIISLNGQWVLVRNALHVPGLGMPLYSLQAHFQQESPMSDSPADRTVRLHRVLKTSPEKVYRAFLEADAMAKWLPPYGFTCKVHHMAPKVGGSFRMSFCNFSSGQSHSFGGEYLELVPNALIRYTDQFDDPNLPGVLEVAVHLKPVLCGTELSIVQSGIPDVIPLEMCYLGWQESLAQLALLVEPDIEG